MLAVVSSRYYACRNLSSVPLVPVDADYDIQTRITGLDQPKLKPVGEEFCAILPETSLPSAVMIAEELRVMVAAHAFHAEGKAIHVSVSIGVACLAPGMVPGMVKDQLYMGADAKLYQAKRTGRNKVCH